ncbi:hypothetical protein A6V39_01075 [Candidatus Mycoplasma haematobovis]|uniref:Uncharacterized protein n=1 Tax=Candidatus Mycoplasma haematobovis TaxID=432608 RepID=A0A1A9QFA2_9MOLU|nr:hypothetical protein [Candidatus Mycoplasma haematobovis]OAL10645.1 hypothetical protein A6V39_01075 [Candidatus Mycoplasma haematobovis]
MFPLVKLLKIALPVATVTSATIATVSLVSSKKEDPKLNSSNEDTVLKDFEKPKEKFEEQIILYSEDGTNEGKSISKEDLERLSKELLDNLSKESSSSFNIDKPHQNLQEEFKKFVPEGDQSQISMEDVEKFLSRGSTQNEEGISKKIEKNDPLANGAEDRDDKFEGENTDSNSLKELDKDQQRTEEEGNPVQDNEGLGQQEISKSKGQDLSKKSSPDGGDSDEGKMSIEKQEKIEPKQSASKDSGVREEDQEQVSSDDSLSETGEADIRQSKSEGDGQKGVSSTGDSSRDEGSLLPETSGKGDDSSHSSSKGHEDGVSGENGQKPMTQEQLQAIEKMGQELEDVLGTLKNLFQISV